ncbi:MAG: hypothetical protein PF495_11785, partial [Spirochaetales bacterium]|nr:hypothetical protein [Spirochaetales bacterium]
MANEYYTNGNTLVDGSTAKASEVSAELQGIQSGFDQLPTPNGTGDGFAIALKILDGVNADEATSKGQMDIHTVDMTALHDTVVAKEGLVNPHYAAIDTVSANNVNVTTVATDITNVNTTAGSIANVNATSGSIASVNTVATDLNLATPTIEAVAAKIANVNIVATDIANVNAAGGNIANVNTVAPYIANVNTTAANIADVNTVATNIADVNNFADTYHGALDTAPTITSHPALSTGDLYFDTSLDVSDNPLNETKVYTGTAWKTAVDTYTKTEVDDKDALKANQATTYTKTEVDDKDALKANKATTYTKT